MQRSSESHHNPHHHSPIQPFPKCIFTSDTRMGGQRSAWASKIEARLGAKRPGESSTRRVSCRVPNRCCRRASSSVTRDELAKGLGCERRIGSTAVQEHGIESTNLHACCAGREQCHGDFLSLGLHCVSDLWYREVYEQGPAFAPGDINHTVDERSP